MVVSLGLPFVITYVGSVAHSLLLSTWEDLPPLLVLGWYMPGQRDHGDTAMLSRERVQFPTAIEGCRNFLGPNQLPDSESAGVTAQDKPYRVVGLAVNSIYALYAYNCMC